LPTAARPRPPRLPERNRLAPGLAGEIAAVPGVARTVPDVSSPVTVLSGNAGTTPLPGLDGATASRVASYQVTSGSLARLSGDTIAIPASWAKSGQEAGDTVMMRFGDNTVTRLRIVALFTARRGYPVLLLPAGSPLIYLTVTALAAALTITVTSLSARLLRTAPSQG
jgi:putative ABC transport system permease protein